MQLAWKQIGAATALLLIIGASATNAQTNAPGVVSPGVVSPGVVSPSRSESRTSAGAVVSPGTSTSAVPPVLGLQQCIDIAGQNNIEVRQGQIQVQGSELQYRQSKLNRYPTLNAFVSQGLNFGRNINPATNTFVDREVRSNNLQLATSVPVFQGFQLKNQILQNETIVAATRKELAATQNNVILNVIQQYLNVLTGAEQLAIAKRQVETSQIQLDRTQKLVNAGSVPEANLYEIRATLANDQLTVVNAQNTVDLAKLALLQAMNLPAGETFEIEFINLPDPRVERYVSSSQQVFETAEATQPQIQGADLRVESARRAVDVARAGLYPRLTFNGSISSIYSSLGLQRFIPDGTLVETQTGAFINVGGISQPVVTVRPGGRAENYGFTEQLNNNLNRSLSLNLNIPIFNNRAVRTNIINATLQQQNARLTADNTRLQLRQQIETAYTNLLASSNRYQATEASVASLVQAFRAAESRFNAGAINPIDYNIAKARLDNARAQLVQAKYDYVFRTKILDFYQNKPLGF